MERDPEPEPGRDHSPRLRPQALGAIKAFHTVVFASVGAALVVTLMDGALGRPRRRTAAAVLRTRR